MSSNLFRNDKVMTMKEREELAADDPVRERILGAAFAAFTDHGYAGASTLDIATRAKVSKRELYAVVGNKEQMLIACIAHRSQRMRPPEGLAPLRDRASLAAALTALGARLLREISDPDVIAVFRLAIAEADRSPEVAQALHSFGRLRSRAAVRDLLTAAQSAGLLAASDPAQMATQFMALLWTDLMVDRLLGVAGPPSPREIGRRARAAIAAFLRLHASDQPESRRK